MRFVACLVVSLSAASFVSAQDLPDVSAPCPRASQITTLNNGDEPGFWFPSSTGRCTLQRMTTLSLFVNRIGLLEERLRIGDEQMALARRQIHLAEQGEQRAVEALESAERLARQARERADKERSLRWVWFGIGVVIVVAVEAVAIWAWTAISD